MFWVQFEIMVFPDHTHFLDSIKNTIYYGSYVKP